MPLQEHRCIQIRSGTGSTTMQVTPMPIIMRSSHLWASITYPYYMDLMDYLLRSRFGLPFCLTRVGPCHFTSTAAYCSIHLGSFTTQNQQHPDVPPQLCPPRLKYSPIGNQPTSCNSPAWPLTTALNPGIQIERARSRSTLRRRMSPGSSHLGRPIRVSVTEPEPDTSLAERCWLRIFPLYGTATRLPCS